MSTQCPVSTGIVGLDEILNGGLPPCRVYIVDGDPGAGKTTLSLQFLLDGARRGEAVLYVTFAETRREIQAVADSHGWQLEGLEILELVPEDGRSENALLHPADVELGRALQQLYDAVERLRPARVVVDSLSELRLVAQEPLRYRREVLSMKSFFTRQDATVLLLDDRTAGGPESHVHSVAHGVITLEQVTPQYGATRRRLHVPKLRGRAYRAGWHDFVVRRGGLAVFPRVVSGVTDRAPVEGVVSSGLASLDGLLGGGFDRGTSALLMGPAGSGKSSIALQFAVAAAERGEPSTIFIFDDNEAGVRRAAARTGLPLEKHRASGLVQLRQIDPAELSPGEFGELVRRRVEDDGGRLIVLDSLNGYLHSMPEERQLTAQLHELLSYLSERGVLTLLLLAQHGLVGTMQSPVDASYLADSVVLLRFFEAHGSVRKAVSVLKRRAGRHEPTIREFAVTDTGIRVGAPLTGFRGVLTGVPDYVGAADALELVDG
jgi:circadian clock protein KaiC